MPLLLVLADRAIDRRKAVKLGESAGFTEFVTKEFASDTQIYLEKALNDLTPLPDAMLVDLDLGIESGFEVLRYWRENPRLAAIPVIVWTVMEAREICTLFGVHRFVAKDDDAGLSEALETALADSTD